MINKLIPVNLRIIYPKLRSNATWDIWFFFYYLTVSTHHPPFSFYENDHPPFTKPQTHLPLTHPPTLLFHWSTTTKTGSTFEALVNNNNKKLRVCSKNYRWIQNILVVFFCFQELMLYIVKHFNLILFLI